jgi:hypothetical protein
MNRENNGRFLGIPGVSGISRQPTVPASGKPSISIAAIVEVAFGLSPAPNVPGENHDRAKEKSLPGFPWLLGFSRISWK